MDIERWDERERKGEREKKRGKKKEGKGEREKVIAMRETEI